MNPKPHGPKDPEIKEFKKFKKPGTKISGSSSRQRGIHGRRGEGSSLVAVFYFVSGRAVLLSNAVLVPHRGRDSGAVVGERDQNPGSISPKPQDQRTGKTRDP